jgi:catalase (peroxidase I)
VNWLILSSSSSMHRPDLNEPDYLLYLHGGLCAASVGELTALVGELKALVGELTASVGELTASVGELAHSFFIFFYS